jgi:hypothetical protein
MPNISLPATTFIAAGKQAPFLAKKSHTQAPRTDYASKIFSVREA